MTRPVPMHPRPGTHPDEVRWVIPTAALPARGIVTSAPLELGELLADGTLIDLRVEDGCVTTRAGSGQDWRRIGPTVRSALSAALLEPESWKTTAAGASLTDVRIASAARRLLDGALGAYTQSHGGEINLVDVRDGVAFIRLRGACRGCPAAESTLRVRFETKLREECADLVGVRDTSRTGP